MKNRNIKKHVIIKVTLGLYLHVRTIIEKIIAVHYKLRILVYVMNILVIEQYYYILLHCRRMFT
jgi:hypothetical protein